MNGPPAVLPDRTPTHPLPPPTPSASSDDPSADRSLIERARRGDRDAFGALVRAHLARALGLARRVLRDDRDAEDAVQDAFLQALRAIDRVEPDRPFWPWLARIVVNRSIDIADARRVRQAEPISPLHPDPEVDPLHRAELSELISRVRTIADTMPPRQRLIVELHDLEGLSVQEIANTTGSASATVRWHLHMGRRALRAALAPLYHDKE